jgi:hypothetical protein
MPPSQCLWFEASSLGEKDKSSFDSRVRFPSVASTRCRLRAGPRSRPSMVICVDTPRPRLRAAA